MYYFLWIAEMEKAKKMLVGFHHLTNVVDWNFSLVYQWVYHEIKSCSSQSRRRRRRRSKQHAHSHNSTNKRSEEKVISLLLRYRGVEVFRISIELTSTVNSIECIL